MRLEHLEVLRGGCAQRSDLGTQRQPGGQSCNTGYGVRVGETREERDGSALGEATDDDAFAGDGMAVETLRGAVVLGLDELLDLVAGLE